MSEFLEPRCRTDWSTPQYVHVLVRSYNVKRVMNIYYTSLIIPRLLGYTGRYYLARCLAKVLKYNSWLEYGGLMCARRTIQWNFKRMIQYTSGNTKFKGSVFVYHFT